MCKYRCSALLPLLVLMASWVASSASAPSVSVSSPDLVVTDGSVMTVTWQGFSASASPVLVVTLYDTADPNRAMRWSASTEMGFSVAKIEDMAVTASACVSVCTRYSPRICAYSYPYFEIMYAPS